MKIFNELADLYPLWRSALQGKNGDEFDQADYLYGILSEPPSRIRSVIDLGGGHGHHACPLSDKGLDMTVFDQSGSALDMVKKNNPGITTRLGSFETIEDNESYDAAICMWSTANYIMAPRDREHFYGWVDDHIGAVFILDQPNFARYPETFSCEYAVEDERYSLHIQRRWHLGSDLIRRTEYAYNITYKETGTRIAATDRELQQFLTLDGIEVLLGRNWTLKYLNGNYSSGEAYDPKTSTRMIAVFQRIA
ncbi:MAG: class I SAM-dependent methyltransferase [archaeon]